ncbi:MAG: hypothetical protein IJ480_11170 [Clostridia bacterium]|nr:hypothetical protein [Clostridia bacterium]
MSRFMKNAVLLLLTAAIASSCGAPADTSDTTAAETSSAADTAPAETEVTSGVPADVTFDNTLVKILYSPTQDNDEILFAAAEETGDVLNDEVYHRNLTVMDKLQVELEFNIIPPGDILNFVRNSVQAADNTFDMITGPQYQLVKMINDGLYLNLIDAPYVDTESPWWAGEYISNVNIGNDRLYFLTGDITPLFLRWISCCYFNKTVYENNYGDPNDMYQLVLEGKWTYDKLAELTQTLYVDNNMNGTTDSEDMLGYGLIKSALTDSLYLNAGASYMERDSDGMPVLNPVTELTVSIMEGLYNIYYGNPASCVYEPTTWDVFNNDITAKFAQDEMLFLFGYFFTSDYLRDMESDYGVIPYPKFDESVAGYRALVHNDVALCALPVTCDKTDIVCAVMEELAFQGYLSTSPAYYDIVLKGKYLRDSSDAAAQLIDAIHDLAYTETGYAYASMTQSAGYMHRTLIDNKSGNIASQWASIQTKAEEALDTLIESYSELE